MELRHIPVSRLKRWPGNPRLNADAIHPVMRSIQAFGFNAPILCDKKLNVIAGHTRLAAAKRLKMRQVPAIVLAIPRRLAQAYAIADNKTAMVAKWDYPQLKRLLEDLQSDIDLSVLGFDDAEVRALLMVRKDFDWDAYDKELMVRASTQQALIPIKVSIEVKEHVLTRIRAIARERAILDRDSAVLAGKVLLALLEDQR